MKENKISVGQFASIAAVSAFVPISRVMPGMGLRIAGESCWIGVLLTFLPLLAVCFSFKSLLSGEDRGLCGAFETVLGKWPGKILSVLIAAWMIFYGGFLVRSGAERYISTVYKNGQLWVFIITIVGVSLVAALGRVCSLSRMAQICAAILGAALLFIFFLSTQDMKKHYLLPLNIMDSGRIGLSVLPALNAATSWVFIGFLSGYVRPQPKSKSVLVKWAAYIIIVMEIVVVAAVGVIGPELAESQQYPFYTLISNLKIFNILERIEPVAVVIWVLTYFVYIAALIMAVGEVGRNVVGSKKRSCFVVLAAVGMVVVAGVVAGNSFALAPLSETIVPLVNLVFAVILVPIFSIIKKKKKDEKRC